MTTCHAEPAVVAPGTGTRLTFLVTTIPSDSHMWNLVALQLLIEELGHHVINLGPCVPVELLVRACRMERPDCVVISTINGHGRDDGAHVIAALRADPELAGLTVVIGGLLSVDGKNDPVRQHELLELGYDAVFPVGARSSSIVLTSFRHFVSRLGERVP